MFSCINCQSPFGNLLLKLSVNVIRQIIATYLEFAPYRLEHLKKKTANIQDWSPRSQGTVTMRLTGLYQ